MGPELKLSAWPCFSSRSCPAKGAPRVYVLKWKLSTQADRCDSTSRDPKYHMFGFFGPLQDFLGIPPKTRPATQMTASCTIPAMVLASSFVMSPLRCTHRRSAWPHACSATVQTGVCPPAIWREHQGASCPGRLRRRAAVIISRRRGRRGHRQAAACHALMELEALQIEVNGRPPGCLLA